MNFRETIRAKHLDAYGLVAPNFHLGNGLGSGNGISYLSLALVIAHLRGEGGRVADWLWLDEALDRCRLPKWPGFVLSRGPGHPDQQEFDDYISLMCALAVLNRTQMGSNLLHECRKVRFRFLGVLPINYWMNNEVFLDPRATQTRHPDGRINWQAWIGRYPAIRACAEIAAGLRPNALKRLGWALALLHGAFRPAHDQGNWRISWLMVQAYRAQPVARSWFCDLAVRIWARKLRAHGGIRATQAGYFPEETAFMQFSWINDDPTGEPLL